jgi:hypothetical protein
MKIEIDKPVIPKFVADWIEFCKDGGTTFYGAITDNLSNSMMDWLFNEEKVDDFAKAWVIGYEVEEPLYYAKIKGWELIKREIDEVYWNLGDGDLFVSDNGELATDEHHTKLTKQQWNELGINDTNADFDKVEQ